MIDRVALVTGASRGIGAAIALRLARDGFAVAVNYKTNEVAAEKVRDEIQALGGRAVLCRFDVSDQAQVVNGVQRIISSAGPIHVLVNNAGIIRDSLLMNMRDDAWAEVLNVNLNGVYYCTKAVVRAMAGKRCPGRRIINITSLIGEIGNVGQCNYAAAKAGVVGLVKCLALELHPLRITVNAIAPGAIETEAIQHLPLKKIADTIPVGRLGLPAEVANVVSFLTSERAAGITGQVVSVDGGLGLWRGSCGGLL